MDMRVNPNAPQTPEPTIGELIRGLLLDVGQLVRSEISLAQSEVSRNIRKAQTPILLMAVGVLLLFGAFLALLAALVGWLAPYVGAGWAAAIVAVGVGLAGVALLATGRRQLRGVALVPTRSVLSLKRDIETMKGNDR